VVYSYTQEHEDELSLKTGQLIKVIGEEEEGWWRGILNGKEGVFPSNFVEEIRLPNNVLQPKPSARLDLTKTTDTAPALPAKPGKEISIKRLLLLIVFPVFLTIFILAQLNLFIVCLSCD